MARCSKCGSPAAVELRYANLRLCPAHFSEFFVRRVARTIKRYRMLRRGDRVLVAVSGGKDSMVLLDVLSKLASDAEVSLVGAVIDLGIRGYSSDAVRCAVRGFEERGVEYVVVNLKREYGFSLDDARRAERRLRRRVCSVCGVVKRYVLNDVALKLGASKVATGHNLDDVAQYVLTGVLSGDYEQLARIYPVSTSEVEGLVTRVKPLAETPEEDVLAYAELNSIDFLRSKCPYSAEASGLELKRLIAELDARHPGIKVSMVRNFFKRLQPILAERYLSGGPRLRRCEACGMPTTSRLCSFCRIRRALSHEGEG
mgnify:CR=1 FL=1